MFCGVDSFELYGIGWNTMKVNSYKNCGGGYLSHEK